MTSSHAMSDDLPVYVISVAAQLSGLHPQTLRAYDRLGLVSPGRSSGRGRRYSMRDILALREIQRLSQQEGVNLSGVKLILDQHRELEQARRLLAELTAELAQLRVELESTRAVAARLAELRRAGPGERPGREDRRDVVPVRGAPAHGARVAIWEPMTGPAAAQPEPDN